jgi:hypothetical protein
MRDNVNLLCIGSPMAGGLRVVNSGSRVGRISICLVDKALE